MICKLQFIRVLVVTRNTRCILMTMCDNLLSVKDYEEILKSVLKNEEAKYISSEFKPISENKEGFLGEHYKLFITYSIKDKLHTKQLFCKTKPVAHRAQRDLVEDTAVFKKEIFFYDFLLKEFEKYGFDTSFVGKYYYSIPNETLVLEDLTTIGYKSPERRKVYDFDGTKALLKSIALFHAAGFAYEQRKSKELQRNFKINEEYSQFLQEILLVMYTKPDAIANDWWLSSFITIEYLIDYLPKDNDFKTEFKTLFKNAEIGKICIQETDFVKTLGHGDLWSNNMMFKYENNIPISCKLIDFQILRYFYPSYDVLLAIYLNTDGELRKKHEQELILYYYQTLTDILTKYGCDINNIMSFDSYMKSFDIIRIEVTTHAACGKLVTYIPPEELTDSVQDEDNTFSEVNKKWKSLCESAFLNNEIYRNVIIETMYDLYNALKLKKN